MTARKNNSRVRRNGDLQEEARRRLESGWGDLAAVERKDLETLVEELEIHREELTIQQQELQEAQAQLQGARDRYRDLFERAPVGYLVVDGRGYIEEGNARASELLGSEGSPLVGAKLSGLVDPSNQDVLYHHLRALAKGDGRRVDELCLGGDEAERRWVQLVSVPELPGGGDQPRFRCALTDITELKLTQEALREERDHLDERVARRTEALERLRAHRERLLNHMGGGLLAMDGEGRVTFVNSAALTMIGLKRAEELVGHSATHLFQACGHAPDEPAEACPLSNVLSQGEALSDWQDSLRRADGSSFPVSLTVTPLQGEGRVIGAVLVFEPRGPGRVDFDALTARENQVLQYLAHGLTNKEVARQLDLSHRTVEDYRARVMKKLGVHSLAELVQLS